MQYKNNFSNELKDYSFTQNVIKSYYPARYWLNNKNLFIHLTFWFFLIWSLISIFSIFIPINNKYRVGHGVIIAFESAFQYVVKILTKKDSDSKENISPVFWNYEAFIFLYLTIIIILLSVYCYRVVFIFLNKIHNIVSKDKRVSWKISVLQKFFKLLLVFSVILAIWTSFSLLYLNKPVSDDIGTILFNSITTSEKQYHRKLTNLGWVTAVANVFFFIFIIFLYFKYCRELFNGNSYFLKEFRSKSNSDVQVIFDSKIQQSIDASLNINEKQDFLVKNSPGYIAELKNVNKYFNVGKGQFHALRDVNLKINDGDFIVILGYSGSGKTTLLNILAGIDRPTTGSCVISGHNITIMRDKDLNLFRRKKIGYIFQNYALLPNLNASENIAITQNMDSGSMIDKFKLLYTEFLNARDFKEKWNMVMDFFKSTFISKGGKEELAYLMDFLNLSEHRNKFPHQLSGGQQQRVSITRALIKKPSILLADEPTGAIDHSMTKSILELFYDINRYAKTTVILITHNPLIAKMAKRVLYVENGTIVRDVVNEKPQHPQEIKGL